MKYHHFKKREFSLNPAFCNYGISRQRSPFPHHPEQATPSVTHFPERAVEAAGRGLRAACHEPPGRRWQQRAAGPDTMLRGRRGGLRCSRGGGGQVSGGGGRAGGSVRGGGVGLERTGLWALGARSASGDPELGELSFSRRHRGHRG